ncbi:MAG TPA: recombinase family protein [Candidatus Absconditabacterales bacterium]|nr:recombinase family protein [Candidatus Absconditabacterales bacterium]
MEIEYVIYCRKSTDENKERQVQSIPDQMRECIEWARSEGLKIKERPADFTMFETEEEIRKQDNDSSTLSQEIYQKYRHLYVIKEQKTAKKPGVRTKRKNLIKLVKDGKIKGIISYHPDRQARNMEEGGALITCVDNGIVDLKYATFAFDSSPTGKMMLGFLFVFSKNYSDNIAMTVTRGLSSSVDRGKSVGKAKYGYIINDEGYHIPDVAKKGKNKDMDSNFELMRKAFHMKIYEKKTNEYIGKWLDANDFTRNKNDKKIEGADRKNFSRVWGDTFYYGLFMHGNAQTDLRESNPYFEPLITESEYAILLEDIKKDSRENPKETRDINETINPIPKGILRMDDGTLLAHSFPNKKRHEKNLMKIRETKPLTRLEDIVKPNQIYYEIKDKRSKYLNMSLKYDEIEKEFIKILKRIKITDEVYNTYVKYCQNQYLEEQSLKREKLNRLNIQRNHLQGTLDKYIAKNLGANRDIKEEEIYQSEKIKKMRLVESIDTEIMLLKEQDRNYILEFEVFLDVFKNAASRFSNLSYVRKRKFLEIAVSNISINEKKRISITLFPYVESLLVSESAPNQTQFEHFYNVVKVAPVVCYRDIFYIYSSLYTDRSAFVDSLTKKQRVLYGMEENTILSSNSVVK